MCAYELRKNEFGDVLVCVCCDYEAPTDEFVMDDGTTLMLCEVCSSTFLSSPLQYPKQYSYETRNLFGAIGWIANMLRDEIRKALPPSAPPPESQGAGEGPRN